MVRLTRSRDRNALARLLYRPQLENLEDRLPPGNLLTWLGWAAPGTPNDPDPEPATMEAGVVDPSLTVDQGAAADPSAAASAEDQYPGFLLDSAPEDANQPAPSSDVTPPDIGAPDASSPVQTGKQASSHDNGLADPLAVFSTDFMGTDGDSAAAPTGDGSFGGTPAAVLAIGLEGPAPAPVSLPEGTSATISGAMDVGTHTPELSPQVLAALAGSATPVPAARMAGEAAASPRSGDTPAAPAAASVASPVLPQDSVPSVSAPDSQRVLDTLASQPLSFVANEGQAGPQVNFVSQGNGYALALSPTTAVLAFHGYVAPAEASGNSAGTVLAMQLDGANPDAQPVGLNELAARSNYFIGNDPSQWHTDVAQYARVAYQNVYPGIDLTYHGTSQQELEYDFTVTPGADPGAIRLQFQGADAVQLDSAGNLDLHTASGDVVQHAPVLYQEVGGVRQTVPGQFVLEGNQVGIQVGAYDHTQPLVIDPTISYSTFLGGSGEDSGNAIAIDTQGNAYVTGFTNDQFYQSQPFPLTPYAFSYNLNSGMQLVFVSRFDPNGALVYSSVFGSLGYNNAHGIAVDSLGDAYVTGGMNGAGFPTTPGAYRTSKYSPQYEDQDAFVTQLDPAGDALVYSTLIGAPWNDDVGESIAVDSVGHAFITGFANNQTFPPMNGLYPTTPGCFQPYPGVSADGHIFDAFVTEFTADGSGLIYSSYLGGPGMAIGYGIALDQADNAYVAGVTSDGFPVTLGAFQTIYGGPPPDSGYPPTDAFVVKVDASGSSLVYSTYLGGSLDDAAYGVAVDSNGDAYVTGTTESPDFPTANAIQPSLGLGTNSSYDAFVTEMNPAGNGLVYSTYLGGTGDDQGNAIAVDSSGTATVTGWTQSSYDFPVVNALPGYPGNPFVTRLSPGGLSFVYSTHIPGGSGSGNGVAVDDAGNAYVTGIIYTMMYGGGFPLVNAYQSTYGGSGDAFVLKLLPPS
jgi:hypothetical protein